MVTHIREFWPQRKKYESQTSICSTSHSLNRVESDPLPLFQTGKVFSWPDQWHTFYGLVLVVRALHIGWTNTKCGFRPIFPQNCKMTSGIRWAVQPVPNIKSVAQTLCTLTASISCCPLVTRLAAVRCKLVRADTTATPSCRRSSTFWSRVRQQKNA